MLMECTGTKASTPLLLPIKVNGKMNKSLMVLYDLLRIIILFGETKPMNRLSLPSAYFGFVAIPLLFLLQVFTVFFCWYSVVITLRAGPTRLTPIFQTNRGENCHISSPFHISFSAFWCCCCHRSSKCQQPLEKLPFHRHRIPTTPESLLSFRSPMVLVEFKPSKYRRLLRLRTLAVPSI